MVELRIGSGPVEVLAYEDFEERVLAGRIPSSAMIRFAPVTGDEFVPVDDLDLVESLRNADRLAWQERFQNSGPPILTMLLVGIQIRIWLAAQLPVTGEQLASAWMNWLPPALENGQMWRIPTSGLLHTDFLHVLLNLVWMAYTGWNLERALGRANVAAIFFFSVFLGGILSMFLTPANPSLGASGGVYGLVAASVVFGFVRHDVLPEKGRTLFGAALAPYLILMFFSGLSNARTDNWAHFGGIVAGAALAFVLDPPGFERGRRNRIVQIGGTVAILLTLVGLNVTGPAIHPLVDHEQARIEALPRAARAKQAPVPGLLTDLEYDVPAGWKPGIDASGQSCFESPAGDHDRSVAVWVRAADEPLTLEGLVEDWSERLRRADQDVEITSRQATWFELPAIEATATLTSGVVLEYRATLRGTVAIQRTNAATLHARKRLDTLFARVDDSIVWNEPVGLQTARRNVLAVPNGVKTRSELAHELARWGDVGQAIAIQRELVDEQPADPERWQALLHTVARFGSPEELFTTADQALARDPLLPALVVGVAGALRERDEAAADGVLQLAWGRVPGDRDLVRALRKARLPHALVDDFQAYQLVWDGPERRTDADRQQWLELPLTVENGRKFADEVADGRAQLAEGFDPDAEDAIQQLYTIRDGGFERTATNDRRLRRDLAAIEAGDPPRWVPPALAERLQQPGVVEGLRARTSDR